MSGRDGEIFAFESSETITSPSTVRTSIESVNFDAENEESAYLTTMDYQTVRRVEQAKSMLRNHSLLAYQSLQTGEPLSLVRAKLKAKLSPNWTPEREADLFAPSSDPPAACPDYTVVTPSHAFIEVDDIPHNGSFVSSYGSYKTFSPGSLKSSDRLKNFK